MMRSLFSGVSGLRAHQGRMDVIGNNIANVNTVGFKSSRMLFADAISQRVSGASSDNPETGRAGRNPMQIGLGVNVSNIDNLMMQGAAQRTDRPLDITIQGEGFFIVSDNSGTYFTRAGNIDWNGNMFSINGMRLMGWPADATGMIRQGSVQPLTTPNTVLSMPPRPTSNLDVFGNINIDDIKDMNGDILYDADGVSLEYLERPMEFYDTIGNRYTALVQMRHIEPTTAATSVWQFDFLKNDAGEVAIWPAGAVINRNDVEDPPANPPPFFIEMSFGGETFDDGEEFPATIAFNHVGTFVGIGENAADAIAGTDPQIRFHFFAGPDNILRPPAVIGGIGTSADPDDGNTGSIRFDFAGLRQQQNERTNMRAMFVDGNPPGSLQDISIGPDGVITGRYSNGDTRALGQIVLAQFRNPAGLERMGNNLWIPSTNSGWFDGVGEIGDMMPGTLEMSNVDLAAEFVEMITTQRGFQANSRIITTSDDILQELVNLKR
jgi:flagellar hook protein FlgE